MCPQFVSFFSHPPAKLVGPLKPMINAHTKSPGVDRSSVHVHGVVINEPHRCPNGCVCVFEPGACRNGKLISGFHATGVSVRMAFAYTHSIDDGRSNICTHTHALGCTQMRTCRGRVRRIPGVTHTVTARNTTYTHMPIGPPTDRPIGDIWRPAAGAPAITRPAIPGCCSQRCAQHRRQSAAVSGTTGSDVAVRPQNIHMGQRYYV